MRTLAATRDENDYTNSYEDVRLEWLNLLGAVADEVVDFVVRDAEVLGLLRGHVSLRIL